MQNSRRSSQAQVSNDPVSANPRSKSNEGQTHGRVSESLNAFIASHSKPSQQERQEDNNELKGPGFGASFHNTLPEEQQVKMNPIKQYLRENQLNFEGSHRQASARNFSPDDQLVQEQQREGRTKSTRSLTRANNEKQVRFDIKEGLMSFMKQSKFEIENISEGKKSNEGSKGPVTRPPKHTDKAYKRKNSRDELQQKQTSARGAPQGPSARPPVAQTKFSMQQSMKMAVQYKQEANARRCRNHLGQTESSTMQSLKESHNDEEESSPQRDGQSLPLPAEQPSLNSRDIITKETPRTSQQMPRARQFSEEPIADRETESPKILASNKSRSVSRGGIVRGPAGSIVRVSSQNRALSNNDRAESVGKENHSSNPSAKMAGQIVRIKQKSQSSQQNFNNPVMSARASLPSHQQASISFCQEETIQIKNVAESIKINDNRIEPSVQQNSAQFHLSPEHNKDQIQHISENASSSALGWNKYQAAAQIEQQCWPYYLNLSQKEFKSHMAVLKTRVSQVKDYLHEMVEDSKKTNLQTQADKKENNTLGLLRMYLPLVILDSVSPMLEDLITLRDRLRCRSKELRHAQALNSATQRPTGKVTAQTRALSSLNSSNTQDNSYLKMCLLQDICSRLQQKIVLRVLHVRSQVRIETEALFLAYFDLLVRKSSQRTTFNAFKIYLGQVFDKREFLTDIYYQMEHLKKVQVFDCWKRLKPLRNLQDAKVQAIQLFLQNRKCVRFVASWRLQATESKSEQLGVCIAARFRLMKLCHQVFAKWSLAQKQNDKIKAKAIRMIHQRKQQGKHFRGNSFRLQESTKSVESAYSDNTSAEQVYENSMERSEERLNADVQELILERDHLKLLCQQIQHSMNSEQLEQRRGLSIFEFLRVTSHYERECVQSQAFAINRDNLYKQWPEMAPGFAQIHAPHNIDKVTQKYLGNFVNKDQTLRPLNATLDTLGEDYQSIGSVNNSPYKNTPLTDALQPVLIRNDDMYQKKEQEIEMKYQIHAALVQQQNMFGKLPNGNNENQESDYVQTVDNRVQIQSSLPVYRSSMNTESQSALTPFYPSSNSKNGQKAPNQLFNKLENQLKQQNLVAQTEYALQEEILQSKVPLDEQLLNHIKSVIQKLKDLAPLQTNSYHMKSALKTLNLLSSDTHEHLSMQDYIQVALSAGISLIELNQVKRASMAMVQWKASFVERLLQADLRALHAHRMKVKVLQQWRKYKVVQTQRADRQYQSAQMHSLCYNLFAKWKNAHQRIICNREQLVRMFKMNKVLQIWKYHMKVDNPNKIGTEQARLWGQKKLKTKALICLYLAFLKGRKVKKFQQRQAFQKFFKRRWKPVAQRQMVLRKVVQKLLYREQFQEKTYFERRQELQSRILHRWLKRATEHKVLLKKFKALTHYKRVLLSKYFEGFKIIFRLSQGCNVLQGLVNRQKQPCFDQMLQVCEYQNHQLNIWRRYRQNYVAQKVVTVWHSLCVQQHLSRMFFMRRYLHGLYLYVARKKALNQRQQTIVEENKNTSIMRICFNGLKKNVQIYGHRRMEENEDQVLLSRIVSMKRKVLDILKTNVLIQRRKNIVDNTVCDFNAFYLKVRFFNICKDFLKHTRRNKLLNQVADQFYTESLATRINEGHHKMIQSEALGGATVTANQDLLQRVLNTMKKSAGLKTKGKSILKQTKEQKFENFLSYKNKLRMVRCFLAWRSQTRLDYSSEERMSPKRREKLFKSQTSLSPNSDLDMIVTLGKNSKVRQSMQKSRTPMTDGHLVNTERDSINMQEMLAGDRPESLVASSQESFCLSSQYGGNPKPTQQDANTFTMGYVNEQSRQQPLRQSQKKSRRSTSRGKNPYSAYSDGKQGFCLTTPSQQDAMSGGFARSYVNTEEKSIDEVEKELKDHHESMQRSAGTRTADLYTELDSIFRNNNEAWGNEQAEREKFLQEMANQYPTMRLSSEYASLDANTKSLGVSLARCSSPSETSITGRPLGSLSLEQYLSKRASIQEQIRKQETGNSQSFKFDSELA